MARIVVIEDDGAQRNDIVDLLTDWGHEVAQASTAAQGFELIKKIRPDLVLSDILMPSESGFDLAKRIREESMEFAHMALILISALDEQKAVAYGEYCGADDYITKPIDEKALKAKIEQHLKKRNGLVARVAKLFTVEVGAKPPVRALAPKPASFGRRQAKI